MDVVYDGRVLNDRGYVEVKKGNTAGSLKFTIDMSEPS